jgi:hypothetical protein
MKICPKCEHEKTKIILEWKPLFPGQIHTCLKCGHIFGVANLPESSGQARASAEAGQGAT